MFLLKFCELRPKWVVNTVNHSGMKSVCVWQYYQNVKWLVSVIPLKLDYKEVFSKIVSSIYSGKCMLHFCFECLRKKKKLNDFLVECFSTNDIDLVDDIFYRQWLSTDRTTLELYNCRGIYFKNC